MSSSTSSAPAGGHDHGITAIGLGEVGRRRLSAVLGISVLILLTEVVGGVVSGSWALIADAGHMLTDVAGLVLALVAAAYARRPATAARTWGFQRAEVLAAAAQSALLLAVGVVVVVEAVVRLVDPPPVAGTAMIAFGIAGLLGNALSVLLLSRSQNESLTTRAALQEVSYDALGAAAVLVAAVIIALTGLRRADPVASLIIGAMILPRTWALLKETVDVLLEAAPRDVDLSEVRKHLLGVDHVTDVHDLHASLVATGLPVLSAHLIVEDRCFRDGHIPELLDDVQGCLVGHFDVRHSTFQFEPAGHLDHERACEGARPAARH